MRICAHLQIFNKKIQSPGIRNLIANKSQNIKFLFEKPLKKQVSDKKGIKKEEPG